jgi:LPS-assembly protein
MKKTAIFCLTLILILAAHFSFAINKSSAEDPQTVITADSMEYMTETATYVAKGSVKVVKADVVIRADTMTYNEATSDVFAEGNVVYDDSKSSFTAQKAEMNMETKTGRLYDADIFYKKVNYHFSGKEIERRGENHYYSNDAKFTTCDSPVPEWCFKGKEVDALIGDRVEAKSASFSIKNLKVFYTPYFWAPIVTERKTGFLLPDIGFSSSKGFNLNIPFFWAISENRDATFVLDTYTKRGIGTGLEYRFIQPGGTKSSWWAYYLRDHKLNRDFWEVNALHDSRFPDKLGGFLSINFVNQQDFYREFKPHFEIRTKRFVESTAEINHPTEDSRLYFLSQYWVDLQYPTGNVPQKLPELGYVMKYRKLGEDFMFSGTAEASYLWRKNGLSAERLDVYPKITASAGKDFVVTQTFAVRGTGYLFENVDDGSYKETLQECENKCLLLPASEIPDCTKICKAEAKGKKDLNIWNKDIQDGHEQRLAFEYDIAGHTRLFKQYSSLIHVMEPSISYHFISASSNSLPVFDSTELYKNASEIEISLLNRIISAEREVLALRITQGFETYNGDRPFMPLKVELGITNPAALKAEVTYNVHTGKFETVSTDLNLQISNNLTLSLVHRFNNPANIQLYKTGIEYSPSKSWKINAGIVYDAEDGEFKDIDVALQYMAQCWGLKLEAIKKPGDFTVMLRFDLVGITTGEGENTEAKVQ